MKKTLFFSTIHSLQRFILYIHFFSFIHFLFLYTLFIPYIHFSCPLSNIHTLYTLFIPFIQYSFPLHNIHSLNPTLIPFIRYSAEPIGPIFCVGPHMTPGKVYGSSKYEKNSWKIVGFVFENAPFRKENPPKFEKMDDFQCDS